MKQLDMRGNPCPIPVIKAKKELENKDIDGVVVLVDEMVSVKNLQKMADGFGYTFSYTQQAEGFAATIAKAGLDRVSTQEEHSSEEPTASADEGITVLITGSQMGRGSEELGNILMKGFLFSLGELSVLPKVVIFLNSGIHLVCEGSTALLDLRSLSDKGTKIYACGTCLNYYGMTEKLAVGEISNMYGISELLAGAAKLVTL